MLNFKNILMTYNEFEKDIELLTSECEKLLVTINYVSSKYSKIKELSKFSDKLQKENTLLSQRNIAVRKDLGNIF